MDPQKLLAQHDIAEGDIAALVDTFKDRVSQHGLSRQADVLLEAAAIDLALGAVEMSQETRAAMGDAPSAKQLLQILTGAEL